MTSTWECMGERKIDPTTRDYVVDDDGFEIWNATTQRVWIALCRIVPVERKKNAMSESIRAQIYKALDHMRKDGSISIVSVDADTSRQGTMAVVVNFVNHSLGRVERLIT